MLKNRHPRDAESIRISAMASDEQTSRIHAAIARRAYEIYKSRGSSARNEVEDWRTAERELLCKLCFGRTTFGQKVWIGTDASRFCEGTIGIWVSPRQLTVFGKPQARNGFASPEGKGSSELETIFRIIPLTDEIDAATARARIRGTALEITATQVRQDEARGLKAA